MSPIELLVKLAYPSFPSGQIPEVQQARKRILADPTRRFPVGDTRRPLYGWSQKPKQPAAPRWSQPTSPEYRPWKGMDPRRGSHPYTQADIGRYGSEIGAAQAFNQDLRVLQDAIRRGEIVVYDNGITRKLVRQREAPMSPQLRRAWINAQRKLDLVRQQAYRKAVQEAEAKGQRPPTYQEFANSWQAPEWWGGLPTTFSSVDAAAWNSKYRAYAQEGQAAIAGGGPHVPEMTPEQYAQLRQRQQMLREQQRQLEIQEGRKRMAEQSGQILQQVVGDEQNKGVIGNTMQTAREAQQLQQKNLSLEREVRVGQARLNRLLDAQEQILQQMRQLESLRAQGQITQEQTQHLIELNKQLLGLKDQIAREQGKVRAYQTEQNKVRTALDRINQQAEGRRRVSEQEAYNQALPNQPPPGLRELHNQYGYPDGKPMSLPRPSTGWDVNQAVPATGGQDSNPVWQLLQWLFGLFGQSPQGAY